MREKLKNIRFADLFPFIIMVGMFIFFDVASGAKFQSAYNLKLLLQNCIAPMIGGLGVLMVVSIGGTDISVGASAGMCATIAAWIVMDTSVQWLAIPLTIIFSSLVGLSVGLIVTKLHVSSFMVTLSLLIGLKGITGYITTVLTTVTAPSNLGFLKSTVFNVILLVGMVALFSYIFGNTKFGFYCKCIGENERTVRAIGINVDRIRIICFVLSGCCAGIVGLTAIVKTGSGSMSLCNMLEMRVQMAIFLGGILTTGGFSARLYKVIVGSVTIVILENGMSVCGVGTAISETIEGIVLVAILIATVALERQSVRRDVALSVKAEKEASEAAA